MKTNSCSVITHLVNIIMDANRKRAIEEDCSPIEEKLVIVDQENDDKLINLCLQCGEDMGEMNPRQLCGKTHCLNQFLLAPYENDDTFIDDIEFDRLATRNEEKNRYMPWKELTENMIYQITHMRVIPSQYGPQIGLRIRNKNNSNFKVFACPLLREELNEKQINLDENDIYITPTGSKDNKYGPYWHYSYRLAFRKKI